MTEPKFEAGQKVRWHRPGHIDHGVFGTIAQVSPDDGSDAVAVHMYYPDDSGWQWPSGEGNPFWCYAPERYLVLDDATMQTGGRIIGAEVPSKTALDLQIATRVIGRGDPVVILDTEHSLDEDEFVASAGKLNPARADKFVELLVDGMEQPSIRVIFDDVVSRECPRGKAEILKAIRAWHNENLAGQSFIGGVAVSFRSGSLYEEEPRVEHEKDRESIEDLARLSKSYIAIKREVIRLREHALLDFGITCDEFKAQVEAVLEEL